MPRASQPAAPVFPTLDSALFALNVDDLKWYLGALPGNIPARKPELVAALKHALTDQATLQSLLAGLTSVQQQVLAEVAHHLGGQYNVGLIEAKYPSSPLPKGPRGYSASFYVIGGKKEPITPFDVFFFYNYELGRYIPSDLAARLRALVPAPAPAQLASQAKPPTIAMQKKYHGKLPELGNTGAAGCDARGIQYSWVVHSDVLECWQNAGIVPQALAAGSAAIT